MFYLQSLHLYNILNRQMFTYEYFVHKFKVIMVMENTHTCYITFIKENYFVSKYIKSKYFTNLI